MQLRDYQIDAQKAIFEEWKQHQATLLCLFTGGGKTIIFADVIRKMQPQRALVLAHREELIFQARDKIERVTALPCEIEMADMVAGNNLFNNASVVISTIQTQISGNGTKRMHRFNPMDFGVVIIDEAHHATSDSYQAVLAHYKQNPDLRILGVTATPDRADEAALGQIFQSVAFDYEILDGIEHGWLVPIEQQIVKISTLDFSNVSTTAGDLNGAQLAAVMESEKNMQGVAGAAIEIIGCKRSIAFCASVAQAQQLCEIFNRYKPGMADFVSGKTVKEERREKLKKFAAGEVQVMCNCGVLSEGYDNPAVECIIQARPTKSRCLYAQQVGRSTRPLPGVVENLENAEERIAAIAASAKPNCLIVDFVGNSGKHKLMTSADILGGKYSEDVVALAVQRTQEKNGAVRMSKVLAEADEELRKLAERRQKEEEARRARLKAKVGYTSKIVNPFDVFDISPVHERGWDLPQQVTEPQINLLLKFGIDANGWSRKKASHMIGTLISRREKGLCNFKQARCLKKYGYDPRTITFSQASSLIESIKTNNWRRPAEPIQS